MDLTGTFIECTTSNGKRITLDNADFLGKRGVVECVLAKNAEALELAMLNSRLSTITITPSSRKKAIDNTLSDGAPVRLVKVTVLREDARGNTTHTLTFPANIVLDTQSFNQALRRFFDAPDGPQDFGRSEPVNSEG